VTVLGIETATTVCGVVALRDGVVIAGAASDEPHAHAEKIMGFVRETTELAGGLRAIDGIAVSCGPGSFTGLRIGLSVAKGLAFASGLPIAAVPTLEALALRAVREGGAREGERLLVLIGARRGEAYAGWFRAGPEWVEPEGEVRVVSLDLLRHEVSRGELPLVTGEVALLGLEPGSAVRRVGPEAARCSAATVALLGARLFREGRVADPATLEPDYRLDFILDAAPSARRKQRT
jgi:tRNA threonylcarbamoyladenosine biosynthesis protein TsaB